MREIWKNVLKQIKELCKVSFKNIKPAIEELRIAICDAIGKFLKFVRTVIVGIINGTVSIVGAGLVATWKYLIAKWFQLWTR